MMTEQFEQGLSRVAELENILSELLDLWNQNELAEVDTDGLVCLTECGEDLFERAGAILSADLED